jgi:hypothetical protein
MGTLGNYLRECREALGIDLRDAAQQTRISIHYLKALEDQDFSKLPGEVFVKGFLKNYGKFLHLDEADLIKRYTELTPQKPVAAAVTAPVEERPEQRAVADAVQNKTTQKISLEPFIWCAGILIALIVFFFFALPSRHPQQKNSPGAVLSKSTQTAPAQAMAAKPEKLYLKVVALENTWILIRTDISPQKKAVLQKGDILTWSADERFQLSYGSAGALALTLNDRELSVNEPKNAAVRDMIVTASGIINKKNQPEFAKPKKQKLQAETATPGQIQPFSQNTRTQQQRSPQRQPREPQRTQTPAQQTPTSTDKPSSQGSQQPLER